MYKRKCFPWLVISLHSNWTKKIFKKKNLDPTDCTRFRECKASNAESDIGHCPKGFLFNSKLNTCEMGRSSHSKICSTIDCSRKTNEVVVYKPNPAYYAFCYVNLETGARETLMFKCEFEHEIYDLSQKMCTFNCKSAGHFQDPLDCNFYYVCSAASLGTFKAERFECPVNYYFDGTRCTTDTSKCSPESLENAM